MSQEDTYIAKKEAQLHELKARIELIKAKAEKATAESGIKFNKQINALEARHKDINNWFDKLRSASEDGFEAVKSGFESILAGVHFLTQQGLILKRPNYGFSMDYRNYHAYSLVAWLGRLPGWQHNTCFAGDCNHCCTGTHYQGADTLLTSKTCLV